MESKGNEKILIGDDKFSISFSELGESGERREPPVRAGRESYREEF